MWQRGSFRLGHDTALWETAYSPSEAFLPNQSPEPIRCTLGSGRSFPAVG